MSVIITVTNKPIQIPPEQKMVAELIMTKRNSDILIVRVFDHPTFDKFYYWFARVGMVSRVSSRDMSLEEIPAYMNKSFRTMPQLQIMDNPKFSYPDKARYQELLVMDLEIPRDIIRPMGSMDWLKLNPADRLPLTEQDRRNIESFHRSESRKLGMRR